MKVARANLIFLARAKIGCAIFPTSLEPNDYKRRVNKEDAHDTIEQKANKPTLVDSVLVDLFLSVVLVERAKDGG